MDTPAMTIDGPVQQTRRQAILREWADLDVEFSTWRPTLMDICTYIDPQRGRFFQTETNKGTRKDQSIVNDTATDAKNKLASAMDTGITSPAREWCHLGLSDPLLTEKASVREYLHELLEVLFKTMAGSNLYKVIRNLYEDLAGPGTSLMFIEEDPEQVFRAVHVPMGQYRLGVNARGQVDRVMRRFQMTISQFVEKFCTADDGSIDLSRASGYVRTSWANHKYDARVEVIHRVGPRLNRKHGKRDSKNKPWASEWLEWNASGTPSASGPSGSEDAHLGLIFESGFDEQPFIAPRWAVVGEDCYGKQSPGWQALGDIKALQSLELTAAKSIAKIMDPPMSGPDSMRTASQLPGAFNRTGANGGKFEPSVVLPPEFVTVTEAKIAKHERRIQRAFFADLLLIIAQDERAQPATAEEVRAKKDETLLQLGGVFSRFADEALRPMIARILAIIQRANRAPQMPDELQQAVLAGAGLHVEFENVLVTAQKTLGITAIQQLIGLATSLAQAHGAGVDQLDSDEILDTAADMLGVKPSALLPAEKVAALRSHLQQQQQAAAQGQAMATAAPAVKQLSEADPEKLQQLLQQFGANAQAQGGRSN